MMESVNINKGYDGLERISLNLNNYILINLIINF